MCTAVLACTGMGAGAVVKRIKGGKFPLKLCILHSSEEQVCHHLISCSPFPSLHLECSPVRESCLSLLKISNILDSRLGALCQRTLHGCNSSKYKVRALSRQIWLHKLSCKCCHTENSSAAALEIWKINEH